MRRIYLFSLLASLFFLMALSWTVAAQSSPAGDLSTPLTIDPQVTIGKLPNGITYYIRPNGKPEKRAELRLAVGVGSVVEDDDQRGLAHLCEHMAFNGTKNFRKQELVNYLESIGMRFGPELNAYTSFDETVYMLSIPTDNDTIVGKAFQVLEDWAHNVSYDPDEIDKERGVVIEEWRQGRGADMRMLDKQLPIIFKDSRYADRLTIGTKESLESFKHESLKRFYKDWYRPDMMAVIAVGDFDKNAIETLIKERFSSIEPRTNPRERVVFPVPGNNDPLFAIASDPEATGSSVEVMFKHPKEYTTNEGEYRRDIVKSLYDGMLNNRLQELTVQADPPFMFAMSGSGGFVRSADMYRLSARVKDNGIERGLKTILTEARRVRLHGFTATELSRQKAEILRGLERAYNEREKTESRRLVGEYVNNFLDREAIPGIEVEYNLYKRFLPGITLDEVNAHARELITTENRVISVDGPQKEGVKIPSQTELEVVFKEAESADVPPYVDNVASKPLLSTPPEAGTIVREKKFDDLGVTEWTLSNGVKVVLKPTDFKNDEILFSAYSPGGSSLVTDADYYPAMTAAAIMAEGGVSDIDQIALQKMLQGKIVGVSTYISELDEGLRGNASPADMETMFQLIYLNLTAPRADTTAFMSFKQRMKGFLENRSSRPETALDDTLTVTLGAYNYRRRPMTEETLGKLDLQQSLKIYRERFSDCGDFIFFFDGAFTPEQIRPFVLTYLGGLPAGKREETWNDLGIRTPRGVIEKSVKKGIEPKSSVRIIFSGPFEWTRENRHALQSMAGVLRIKLREALREEKGGTYGVGVGGSPVHFPQPEYRMIVSWGCSPDRVSELVATAMQQIDSLRNVDVSDIYITKVKESQKRERELNLKENRFWLNALSFAYVNGENPENILHDGELTETITPASIRAAANGYLDQKNFVKVVLYPADR
jgi:zinc protease